MLLVKYMFDTLCERAIFFLSLAWERDLILKFEVFFGDIKVLYESANCILSVTFDNRDQNCNFFDFFLVGSSKNVNSEQF